MKTISKSQQLEIRKLIEQTKSEELTIDESTKRICNLIQNPPVYMHTLNTRMVQSFVAFVDNYFETGNSSTPSDFKTFPQFDVYTVNNFQKLKYFGLIKKSGEGFGWFPTTYGLEFYNGQIMCLNRQKTQAGEVLSLHHSSWEESKQQPDGMFIWQYLDQREFDWTKKIEFQKQAKDHYQQTLI